MGNNNNQITITTRTTTITLHNDNNSTTLIQKLLDQLHTNLGNSNTNLGIVTTTVNNNEEEEYNMDNGATDEEINKIPKRTVSKEESIKENTCCICFNEMIENEIIRELPCGHCYHAECIDKWLAINKVCPVDKKLINLE